jgi:hypothetical protein
VLQSAVGILALVHLKNQQCQRDFVLNLAQACSTTGIQSVEALLTLSLPSVLLGTTEACDTSGLEAVSTPTLSITTKKHVSS